MKHLIYALLIIVAAYGSANCQNEKYDKILILIVNEDFEKALYKAENFTLKDDSKKDPIPYLYCSMAYFELSKRNEFQEKYPKAFAEALKYAGKFKKKDTKNEFVPEHLEYLDDLRKEAYVQAEVLNDQQKWTRSKAIYKGLVDVDPADPGALLFQAFANYKAKSNRDAELLTTAAKESLSKNGVDNLSKDQMEYLKRAVITISEYLQGSGNKTKAKEWVELCHSHFKEDKEYMVTYGNITG